MAPQKLSCPESQHSDFPYAPPPHLRGKELAWVWNVLELKAFSQQVTQMVEGDDVLWPELETGPLFGATRRKRDGWSISITLWGS